MQEKKTELQKEIDQGFYLGLFAFGILELIIILTIVSNISQPSKHGLLIIAIIFIHLFSLLFISGARGLFTKGKKSKGYIAGSLVFILIYIGINLCAIFLAFMLTMGFSACPSCT